MGAAHSGSSLVTSLFNNPHSIRISAGVTCTVLSSNERMFMFIPESSCWTRFERSNRSKGTETFWIRSLPLSPLVIQGVPELDILTYPTISSREVLRKSRCPKTRILPWFLPNWPASAPTFHKIQFVFEASRILVLVTHPVLYYRVVSIQPD